MWCQVRRAHLHPWEWEWATWTVALEVGFYWALQAASSDGLLNFYWLVSTFVSFPSLYRDISIFYSFVWFLNLYSLALLSYGCLKYLPKLEKCTISKWQFCTHSSREQIERTEAGEPWGPPTVDIAQKGNYSSVDRKVIRRSLSLKADMHLVFLFPHLLVYH